MKSKVHILNFDLNFVMILVFLKMGIFASFPQKFSTVFHWITYMNLLLEWRIPSSNLFIEPFGIPPVQEEVHFLLSMNKILNSMKR